VKTIQLTRSLSFPTCLAVLGLSILTLSISACGGSSSSSETAAIADDDNPATSQDTMDTNPDDSVSQVETESELVTEGTRLSQLIADPIDWGMDTQPVVEFSDYPAETVLTATYDSGSVLSVQLNYFETEIVGYTLSNPNIANVDVELYPSGMIKQIVIDESEKLLFEPIDENSSRLSFVHDAGASEVEIQEFLDTGQLDSELVSKISVPESLRDGVDETPDFEVRTLTFNTNYCGLPSPAATSIDVTISQRDPVREFFPRDRSREFFPTISEGSGQSSASVLVTSDNTTLLVPSVLATQCAATKALMNVQCLVGNEVVGGAVEARNFGSRISRGVSGFLNAISITGTIACTELRKVTDNLCTAENYEAAAAVANSYKDRLPIEARYNASSLLAGTKKVPENPVTVSLMLSENMEVDLFNTELGTDVDIKITDLIPTDRGSIEYNTSCWTEETLLTVEVRDFNDPCNPTASVQQTPIQSQRGLSFREFILSEPDFMVESIVNDVDFAENTYKREVSAKLVRNGVTLDQLDKEIVLDNPDTAACLSGPPLVFAIERQNGDLEGSADYITSGSRTYMSDVGSTTVSLSGGTVSLASSISATGTEEGRVSGAHSVLGTLFISSECFDDDPVTINASVTTSAFANPRPESGSLADASDAVASAWILPMPVVQGVRDIQEFVSNRAEVPAGTVYEMQFDKPNRRTIGITDFNTTEIGATLDQYEEKYWRGFQLHSSTTVESGFPQRAAASSSITASFTGNGLCF